MKTKIDTFRIKLMNILETNFTMKINRSRKQANLILQLL
jgi:hypothetical protein